MKQLVQLQEHGAEFKSLNAEVVVIFREEEGGVAALRKIKERTNTTFTLATDLNKESSAAYSPKRMTFDNFVIDKGGNVKAVISGTLKTRATAEQLLTNLREIENR